MKTNRNCAHTRKSNIIGQTLY